MNKLVMITILLFSSNVFAESRAQHREIDTCSLGYSDESPAWLTDDMQARMRKECFLFINSISIGFAHLSGEVSKFSKKHNGTISVSCSYPGYEPFPYDFERHISTAIQAGKEAKLRHLEHNSDEDLADHSAKQVEINTFLKLIIADRCHMRINN